VASCTVLRADGRGLRSQPESDTDGFRHHSSSPVGRLDGRIGLGERHNTLGDIRP